MSLESWPPPPPPKIRRWAVVLAALGVAVAVGALLLVREGELIQARSWLGF